MSRPRRRSYRARPWHRDYFPVTHVGRFMRAQLAAFVVPGARVLDVGCGDQPLRSEVERRGGRYLGVDLESGGDEARVQVIGSGLALPIRGGSCELVVCSEVLEHVPAPADAFGELVRVTCPGGRIVLTVPFIYPLHEEPYDFVRLTPHAIARLASIHGLEVEHLEAAGHEFHAMATLLDMWLVRTLPTRASAARRACGVLIRTMANTLALAAGRSRRTPPIAFTNVLALLRRPA